MLCERITILTWCELELDSFHSVSLEVSHEEPYQSYSSGQPPLVNHRFFGRKADFFFESQNALKRLKMGSKR